MTVEETTIRQVVQELYQQEPRPGRAAIEEAVHRRVGYLGRADWWRVHEILNKILGEQ